MIYFDFAAVKSGGKTYYDQNHRMVNVEEEMLRGD
jgi:hypothetical protein